MIILNYLKISFKKIILYKKSFYLSLIGQFLVTFSAFIGVLFMLHRFEKINGYTLSEILLFFSITLFSFSIAEGVFKGFDRFPVLIKQGTLDSYLIRPQNLIIQVIANNLDLTKIGRVLQSLLMFIYCIFYSDVNWSVLKMFTLLLIIITSCLIFSCLYIIYAGICFFTLDKVEIFNLLTQGSREFGKYPIDVYGDFVLKFSTFFIPFALVQYYPYLYIIDHSDNIIFVTLPFISILFIIPTTIIWKLGLRNYQSSGS